MIIILKTNTHSRESQSLNLDIDVQLNNIDFFLVNLNLWT